MGFRVSSQKVQRSFQVQIPFSLYSEAPSVELLSRKIISPSQRPQEFGGNTVHLVDEGNCTFF